jgi:hypothetical protein
LVVVAEVKVSQRDFCALLSCEEKKAAEKNRFLF